MGSKCTPTLNVIAAACENMGIGYRGELPWRLRKEMQFFKQKTSSTDQEGKENAVIMGSKTWFAIPEKFRPLSGRINVVLSRTMSEMKGPHYVSSSLEDAVSWLTSPQMEKKVDKLFVIGGAVIYQIALESSYNLRIYLTRIHRNFTCDTFFPPLPEDKYALVDNQDVPPGTISEDGITYNYTVYARK